MKIIKSISVEFENEERDAIGKVAELLEELCNCGDGNGECQGCPLECHCRQRSTAPLYEVLYDILSLEEDGNLGCDSRLV